MLPVQLVTVETYRLAAREQNCHTSVPSAFGKAAGEGQEWSPTLAMVSIRI